MKVSKSGWIPCFKRPSFVLNPGSKDFIAFPLAYCINALHNFFFVRIFLITSGLLMYLTITMLLLSDIICWNRSQTALKKFPASYVRGMAGRFSAKRRLTRGTLSCKTPRPLGKFLSLLDWFYNPSVWPGVRPHGEASEMCISINSGCFSMQPNLRTIKHHKNIEKKPVNDASQVRSW